MVVLTPPTGDSIYCWVSSLSIQSLCLDWVIFSAYVPLAPQHILVLIVSCVHLCLISPWLFICPCVCCALLVHCILSCEFMFVLVLALVFIFVFKFFVIVWQKFCDSMMKSCFHIFLMFEMVYIIAFIIVLLWFYVCVCVVTESLENTLDWLHRRASI